MIPKYLIDIMIIHYLLKMFQLTFIRRMAYKHHNELFLKIHRTVDLEDVILELKHEIDNI